MNERELNDPMNAPPYVDRYAYTPIAVHYVDGPNAHISGGVRYINAHYAMNSRNWYYYPIVMPINKDGGGPAIVGEDAVDIKWEVWGQDLTLHASFDFLYDAIDYAMKLNQATENGKIELTEHNKPSC